MLGATLCEIRVDGTCIGKPNHPGLGWFDDSTHGGPNATSWDACNERFKSWKHLCGRQATVAVRFDLFGRRGISGSRSRSTRPALFAAPIAAGTKPLHDTYITLWLHQVHKWFPSHKGKSQKTITQFLRTAKNAGVTTIMTDIPWAWTEREAEGRIDFLSFGKEWHGEVCRSGLRLLVVLNMREFPPWVTRERFGEGVSEKVSPHPECLRHPEAANLWTPSIANSTTAALISSFVDAAARHLVATHGSCLAGISPSMNNELETRYTQTFDCARDYSSASRLAYEQWQYARNPAEAPLSPPVISPYPVCTPNTAVAWHRWLEFREQALAEHYERLCARTHMHGARCFLHFGEFFATTDLLNANLFFTLAKSPHVDELVIDSNMALLGAASSPSVVGLLVSTARMHGKTVHYEAATERVIPCDEAGKLVERQAQSKPRQAAAWLYREGISRALESGVDSLGFTNLCEPSQITSLMPNGTLLEVRVSHVPATAVLYVPYRALYAYNFVIGKSCGARELPCWASSFSELPRFGRGIQDQSGMCTQDFIQHALLEIWDDLRTRHSFVAVVGTARQLTAKLLATTSENVIVQFAGLMDDRAWRFGGGDAEQKRMQRIMAKHSFSKVLLPAKPTSYHPNFMNLMRKGSPGRWMPFTSI